MTIIELSKAIQNGTADLHNYGLDEHGVIEVGPIEGDGMRRSLKGSDDWKAMHHANVIMDELRIVAEARADNEARLKLVASIQPKRSRGRKISLIILVALGMVTFLFAGIFIGTWLRIGQ